MKVTFKLQGLATSFEVDGKPVGQQVEQSLLGGCLQALCKSEDHGNVDKILQLWLVNSNENRAVREFTAPLSRRV
jgi:hypothetical protein